MSTHHYSRIIQAVRSQVWALEEAKFDAMLAFLELKASGGFPNDDILASIRADSSAMSARASAVSQSQGSVAILCLYGLISQRASMVSQMSGPGGTSITSFTAQFRQAMNDPSVKAIVMDICSPGGSTDGVAELSDEIFRGRASKPITAVSNALACSAAYWIGCSASRFIVSPSSMTGSIGVYSSHVDESAALDKAGVKVSLISAGKFKTEGNPFEPLGNDARAALQSTVEDFYQLFVNAVARGRGVSPSAVRDGFGQGRAVTAQRAVAMRMADKVGTLDAVLAEYGVTLNTAPRRALASANRASVPSATPSAFSSLGISPRESGRGNFI